MDNGTKSNIITSLEAENCTHTYNHHNIHHNNDTIWYDFIDINVINIHGYYDSIGSNDKTHNHYDVFEIPDDVTVKHDNITDLYKLEDPYRY